MLTFKTVGQQLHQQFIGSAPQVGTESVGEKQSYTLRHLFTKGLFSSRLHLPVAGTTSMEGRFVEPAIPILQIRIYLLQLGFDCFRECKTTIKP